MNDRELLELAAKAAGVKLFWKSKPMKDEDGYIFHQVFAQLEGQTREWSPLTDGGDALALAHQLKIDIFIKDSYACCGMPDSDDYVFVEDPSLKGVYKAITTAAAEIGRNLK